MVKRLAAKFADSHAADTSARKLAMEQEVGSDNFPVLEVRVGVRVGDWVGGGAAVVVAVSGREMGLPQCSVDSQQHEHGGSLLPQRLPRLSLTPHSLYPSHSALLQALSNSTVLSVQTDNHQQQMFKDTEQYSRLASQNIMSVFSCIIAGR